MKKIVYGLLATLSGLVLLFSYRTSLGEAVVASPASDGASTSVDSAAATTSSGSSAASTPSESATGSSEPTSTALTDGTYTGSAVNTRYGPVQVQSTVSGGLITDVQAVDYPDGNGRDRQINARAIPILVSETLDAQSAEITAISASSST